MPHKVKLSNLAASDIRQIVSYIRAKSGIASGTRWWRGLLQLIRSLNEMPFRGTLLPEEELAANGYRQVIYHSHRVIYQVQQDEVEIGRIFHSSRDRLSPEDLPENLPEADQD